MAGEWNFGGAYADTEARLVETDQKREMFPLEVTHKQSIARLNNAQAAIMENNLRSDQQMRSIMEGLQLDDPDESPSSAIMRMAGAAARAGDPKSASEMLLRAAQLQSQTARQSASAAAARTSLVNAQVKMADRYATLIANVRSQEEFDTANAIFAREFPGETPIVTQYDPETVRLLRDSSIKMRDRLYADHSKEMERLANERLEDTRKYRKGVLDLRERAEQRRKEEADRKAKVGGKDVGAPSKTEIEQAMLLLKREGKDVGLGKGGAGTAAFDVASLAKSLQQNNHGLGAGEAMERALVQRIAEGYFVEKRAGGLRGFMGQRETSYGRPGGNPNRALTLPKDLASRKPNTYYNTPKGPLLYLGDGKWQAPASTPAPPSRSVFGAAEEPDDEEEEDE